MDIEVNTINIGDYNIGILNVRPRRTAKTEGSGESTIQRREWLRDQLCPLIYSPVMIYKRFSLFYHHKKKKYWYFKRAILKKINIIYNVICSFHNIEGNFQYGHVICNMNMCVLFFKFAINDPVSQFNEKICFLLIRILILQSCSLFSVCEIFNIIDHTRILNFIIFISMKLYINLY